MTYTFYSQKEGDPTYYSPNRQYLIYQSLNSQHQMIILNCGQVYVDANWDWITPDDASWKFTQITI